MKLVQIAKRGSGRMIQVQFTLAEWINVIAMFQSVLMHVDVGYSKEKKMLTTMKKILAILEDVTREDVDYHKVIQDYGKTYYDNQTGEVDAIQRFVSEGTGDSIQ
jgi:hypothetical protein